ncbi:hypothetical protein MCHK_12145 (plasmid) [Mesorhizobium huakuii 7653R]|nr:hypothetical protein MCHK_12145 [Mesorhizobium huakuii 7653R]
MRAAINAAIITSAATPDSHPDCRALLIRIVAPHGCLRIPTKPAIDSDLKPASHSDFIPAGVPI